MSHEKEGNQILAAIGAFTWPSEKPQLIGGKCKTCGSVYFPKHLPFHKPDCKGEAEEILLSRTGKLESYTVQHYAPPPPFIRAEPFVPYGVGLVSLPEGISVAGMLTGIAIEDIKVGMDMELVIEKMGDDNKGNCYLTWKFRPIETVRV